MSRGRGKSKEWEQWEDEIVRRVYPEGGSPEVKKLLPHRSPVAIRRHAQIMGVGNLAMANNEPGNWSLPATTLCEQLECVKLKRWRYPVEPSSLLRKVA